MNQKGFAQGYARILDRVAGNQVPHNLDLAPNIMAQIQKRKRFRMQSRMKLFSAAGLAAIVLIVMISAVPGMAAAIGRWFGYVPGIGFVRDGQLRVLSEPVSVTREGVTVTVEQVVIDPERTALVYSVEGIPISAIASSPEHQHCAYKAILRLPDGSPLLASPNGIESWGSGYLHRFNYPPLPPTVNEATLVIDCLFNTIPGSAPESWEIPLHFIPAPADVTAFPVIEIPTPEATAAPSQTASENAAEPVIVSTEESSQPVSMSLTLDRAVQMDDGYLIYASVHWQDTPFASVDVTSPTDILHLLDANGQTMQYELRYEEQTGVFIDQRQTIFAIKTEPVQASGPLTLALDSVSVDLPVEGVSFVFDPGPNPKPGQTWTLNQDVNVGQYHLRVRNVVAESGGYSFEMSSDSGILNANVMDHAHLVVSGGGGGGSGSPGENFFAFINYADGQLPAGPITITISSIGVRHSQRLEAQWTPPAVSPDQLPTQPAACLTGAAWKAAIAQKPALPGDLTGRVLAGGQFDKPGSDQWSLKIFDLADSQQQKIEGAQDGSLSPDGAKLAYSIFGDGIYMKDLAAGQTTPLPGTVNGDFNPIWSPDGRQIVFNRGMGVFDLFIVATDGADMRQITHGGVQEWPVGWLPDGRLLYTVPGRENEYTIFGVDVHSGNTEEVLNANISSISPDGRHTLIYERTFGDRWLVYVSEMDGSNRWLLNDSDLWVLTPVWSPDGEWLLAGVSDSDSGSTMGTLINLRTCQVIPLPDLKGNFLSWVR